MIRYAKFEGAEVLETKSSNHRVKNASLDKMAEFDNFRTENDYLYVRIRAISSRINQNHDSWGSIDLAGSPEIFNQHKSSTGGFTIQANRDAKFGFSTFLGKPIFVDHNNSDPRRARGVVVDAKLHVDDQKTASLDPFYSSNEAEDYHLPPTWVELLLEVDAKSFPKFAKAIIDGAKDNTTGIDGFSMGANIKESFCNICNNKAEDESQFCQHIKMKGAPFKATNSRTGKKVMKKAAEKCVGIGFFEISGVFAPADETALTQELVQAIQREGSITTQKSWNKTLKTSAVNFMDDGRTCPSCGGQLDPDHAMTCTTCGFQKTATGYVNPEEVAAKYNYDPNDSVNAPYIESEMPPLFLNISGNKGNRSYPTRYQDSWSHYWDAYDHAAGEFESPDDSDSAYYTVKKPDFQVMSKTADLGFEPLEPPEYDPNAKPKERNFYIPCTTCNAAGWDTQTGEKCPACQGTGTFDQRMMKSVPQGDITGLIDENDPSKYQPMNMSMENALVNAVHNDARNSSIRLAEGDLPQVDMLSVPEKVDTLRKEEVCDVCGSNINHGNKCEVCGWSPPPDSLDNPDLDKAKEMAAQNNAPDGTHTEGFPDPLEQAMTPPPAEAPPMPPAPNFQSSSHNVISDMDWDFIHPKLGMGKINPIERPVLPTGAPATNDPVRETVITNPTQPVISRTAAQMIAATKQKENHMTNVVAADHQTLPEAAHADAQVGVVETGGVMDASNEEASKADAQVDVLGVGATGVTDVGADHQSVEDTASEGSDDSGFNTDHTTDDSGPTMTWDLNYSPSAVEQQETPVTHEPYPASEDGVKKSGLDAEPYPSDGGPDLAGGAAVEGTQPADPVGNAMERVDVLSPATTPEANNSGPTITWTGTDGNKIHRQQDPVTGETLEGEDGVKKITSHVVNATKLVDLETEMGVLKPEDKYNRLASLLETAPEILAAQLSTLSRVKTAGLKRAPSITRTAGRVPSFAKAASIQTTAKSEANAAFDESLFL